MGALKCVKMTINTYNMLEKIIIKHTNKQKIRNTKAKQNIIAQKNLEGKASIVRETLPLHSKKEFFCSCFD